MHGRYPARPAAADVSLSVYALKLLVLLGFGLVAIMLLSTSLTFGILTLMLMGLCGVMIYTDEQPTDMIPGRVAIQLLLTEVAERRYEGEVFNFAYGVPERSVTRR